MREKLAPASPVRRYGGNAEEEDTMKRMLMNALGGLAILAILWPAALEAG